LTPLHRRISTPFWAVAIVDVRSAEVDHDMTAHLSQLSDRRFILDQESLHQERRVEPWPFQSRREHAH